MLKFDEAAAEALELGIDLAHDCGDAAPECACEVEHAAGDVECPQRAAHSACDHDRARLRVERQAAALADEILSEKKALGDEAYLWVQSDAGDVILWASEKVSEDDDGASAERRWYIQDDDVSRRVDALLGAEIDGWN